VASPRYTTRVPVGFVGNCTVSGANAQAARGSGLPRAACALAPLLQLGAACPQLQQLACARGVVILLFLLDGSKKHDNWLSVFLHH